MSAKQVNVVYANVKQGNLNLTKEQTSKLYAMLDRDYRDLVRPQFTGGFSIVDKFDLAIDKIFKKDYENAERILNEIC